MPRGISLVRTSSHGEGEGNRKNLVDFATKDPFSPSHNYCWRHVHWPLRTSSVLNLCHSQLSELHGDFTSHNGTRDSILYLDSMLAATSSFSHQSHSKKAGRGDCTLKSYINTRSPETWKSKEIWYHQGNMIPPKRHNNFPVTYSKEMEIYKLLEKEFPDNYHKELSKI